MTDKDFFIHESSYVDEGVTIGTGTRIWHFCHVIGGSRIGEKLGVDLRCRRCGDRYQLGKGNLYKM